MNNYTRTILGLLLVLSGTIISCHKEFLDIKPSKTMVVPNTLKDLQALLDNSEIFNTRTPFLGEIGTDDYYITGDRWNALSNPPQKNAYIWASDIYEGYEHGLDWVYSYERVFYANLALEGISKIQPNTAIEMTEWANIKGSSLFLRAKSFYELAQIFCMPFDPDNSERELGIVLKLESDIDADFARSSVLDTYRHIIQDLLEASELLPTVAESKTRATKAAAYAMLSKVYLTMFDYENALEYAERCIELNPEILDFNLINTDANFPFERFNGEVIFHSSMLSATILNQTRLLVPDEFYEVYDERDLRRRAFFTEGSTRTFKGSYNNDAVLFSGISTNDVILIQSECYARLGNIDRALEILNDLLVNRYENGYFQPIQSSGMEETLAIILLERRKELVYRGSRWTDIRRLNKEGNNIHLIRQVNGTTYELPPNDARYALPLPDLVVIISGLEQNPR